MLTRHPTIIQTSSPAFSWCQAKFSVVSSEMPVLQYLLWSFKYEKAHRTGAAWDSSSKTLILILPDEGKEIYFYLSWPLFIEHPWYPRWEHLQEIHLVLPRASEPQSIPDRLSMRFFSTGSCGFYSFAYLPSGGILCLFILWQILRSSVCSGNYVQKEMPLLTQNESLRFFQKRMLIFRWSSR